MKILKKVRLLLSIVLASAIVLSTGCKKRNKKKAGSEDAGLYSNINFSDLTLPAGALDLFFKTFSLSDKLKKEVVQFYETRDFQYGWINKNGMTDAVPNFYSTLKNVNLDDTSHDNSVLDKLITEAQTDQKAFLSETGKVQEMELLLTTAFFKYAKNVYSGPSNEPADLDRFIAKKKKNYQKFKDWLVASKPSSTTYESQNPYYIKLKEKLKQYAGIQKSGGFPVIKIPTKDAAKGMSDAGVVALKTYLWLSGDLKVNDNTPLFNDTLELAVLNFQSRIGLEKTGRIDSATLAELNIPISFRIKQIIVNMQRLRWVPEKMENQFLLINIPEFRLSVFEGGKKIWASNVVVGKAATRTSIFKGNVSQIILNPYWNIPASIVETEILPSLKKNPNYLAKNHMEALSGNRVVNPHAVNWNKYEKDAPFMFRQKPGSKNALGKMKFLFPNSFDIYLHDTPSKGLFGESDRAFSHGCIRVSEPQKLALYLLKNKTDWTNERLNKVLKTGKDVSIAINPIVPVYITYFTAWVDSNGQLNLRNDLYALDDKLYKEIFEK